MKAIMEIQRDPNLTDAEKGTRRQLLMSGKWAPTAEEKKEEAGERPRLGEAPDPPGGPSAQGAGPSGCAGPRGGP